MTFNSLHFAFFFIIVYILYRLATHRLQNPLLLIASYVFYSFWDWRFLSLLLLSTAVNFLCGLKIDGLPDGGGKRGWLTATICFNLGLLGIFKYFNFFSEGFRTLLWLVGLQASPMTLDIVLPLGISFYTFQVMSYPIDIYWGTLKPTRRFFDFALFVSFFPLIISGPIERARNLLPQILDKRRISAEKVYGGCWLILWGLYKKLVIADNLARLTARFFAPYHPGLPGSLTFVMMIAFTFQLYADFSGYSDMARGLAKLMGFEIMLNFRTPFFSQNPSELWQRWHISLTTWIKEYLYYPLGLARLFGRQMNAYAAILLTWGIMGFWHGPQFKYIVWGVYHGILIIIYSKLRPFAVTAKPVSKFASGAFAAMKAAVMFMLFSIGLLFFAANSTMGALAVIRDIAFNFSKPFHPNQTFSLFSYALALFLLPLVLLEYFQYKADDELVIFKWPALVKGAIYFILLYSIMLFGVFSVQKYYYFQF